MEITNLYTDAWQSAVFSYMAFCFFFLIMQYGFTNTIALPSVDLVKALKVMAAFQLPDPSHDNLGHEELNSIRCKPLTFKCIY